jgi:hypothetical protein
MGVEIEGLYAACSPFLEANIGRTLQELGVVIERATTGPSDIITGVIIAEARRRLTIASFSACVEIKAASAFSRLGDLVMRLGASRVVQ